MIDINPEEVVTWETKKLWNILNMLKEGNNNIFINDIKFGFKIKCPIWYLSEEWVEIYPSSRKVKILGYGKFKLDDFMEEKEKRDSMMRKTILENIDDGGLIEGRVD